jgi:hypothetical protein
MNRPDRTTSLLPAIALLFVVYSGIVTFLTGDIGFEGDDWWIFSWAYWNTFPESLLVYARESLRPVEGIYYISFFELVGFNKVAFHLGSLLLSAGACTLMALSLYRAFPGRHTLVLATAFFAFFAPMVSCLTFVMTTDNSRLSLLLFWAGVLGFQRWARRSAPWRGLVVPVSFYLLAFLTYEAASLLILAVPLLVLPVHMRSGSELSDRSFLFRLGASIFISLVIAISTRFLFLNGGIVSHRHVLPPFELVWSYLALLPFYLMEPFTAISRSPVAWLIGLGVMAVFGYLLHRFPDEHQENVSSGTPLWKRVDLYPLLLGLAMLFLGMLPYQLAGYGSVEPKIMDSVMHEWGLMPDGNSAWFNFNWSSRIYSAATFGLAILMAVAVDCRRARWMQWATRPAAIVVIGLFAVFHAGLIPEWQEASRMRAGLSSDLLSQAPDVKPGTNFAFVNLDSRNERAVVFRGWMGMRSLIQMLYDEPELSGWYVYPYSRLAPNHVFQQAVVTPNGFVSRGLKMDRPIPLESLIVFNRKGPHLKLLNKIASNDGLAPTGISWNGISAFPSNLKRIVRPPQRIADRRRSALNEALRREVSGLEDQATPKSPSIAGATDERVSSK